MRVFFLAIHPTTYTRKLHLILNYTQSFSLKCVCFGLRIHCSNVRIWIDLGLYGPRLLTGKAQPVLEFDFALTSWRDHFDHNSPFSQESYGPYSLWAYFSSTWQSLVDPELRCGIDTNTNLKHWEVCRNFWSKR